MIIFGASSNVDLLLHDNSATLDGFLDALHYVPVECHEGCDTLKPSCKQLSYGSQPDVQHVGQASRHSVSNLS